MRLTAVTAFLRTASHLLAKRAVCSVLAVLAATSVGAQTLPVHLPSAAEPGREATQPAMPLKPSAVPGVAVPKGQPGLQAPAGADRLRFTLQALDIEGATHYPPQALRPLYAHLLNRSISVAQAFEVANQIELRYRGDGYVTTRVIVPEQTVEDGRFRIVVIEGFVSDVVYEGDIGASRAAVEKLISRLRGMRPVSIAELERQLLLANDLPGLTVRATLEASPTQTGGSVLVVRTERKWMDASLGIDNRNSPYLGSGELVGSVSVNAIGARADRLTINGRLGNPFSRYKTVGLNYDLLLTEQGTTLSLNAAYANSLPGRELADLDVESDVYAYTATVTHPLIRSRQQNLRIMGQFEARDVSTDILDTPFTRDRLRIARLGLSYDRTDGWNGITAVRGTLHQGLHGLGATPNGSTLASRANGRSDFFKITAEITRIQQVSDRVSLVAAFAGQYSPHMLLASEEFALGGGSFGRGYDYGEMSADKGMAASLEVRYALPNTYLPYGSHVYGFVDGGRLWAHQDAAPLAQRSLSSFGAGMRANLRKNVFATVEVAKPINPVVGTQGNKHPRVFFSISAYY
ncbi:ShlB/FhaC/HecB family hemolysin secretion/activation protein [Parapusillimonas sp. SGNA-6]|nr:ShlB/FhaC/HecB family hemolysin secretion/activation protein [Parapusillimonas sp. SGNA-6]